MTPILLLGLTAAAVVIAAARAGTQRRALPIRIRPGENRAFPGDVDNGEPSADGRT